MMTPYQRDMQLQETIYSIRQYDWEAELVIVHDNRPHKDGEWMNPAPLLNQAIRKAKGDILIQQNAECKHMNHVLDALSEVPKGECWFASCMSLNQDGSEDKWYCHPEFSPRPLFFCGVIHKEDMLEYDEDFTGYGYEDNDMATRLQANGIKFKFLPPEVALVHHQWHPPFAGNSNMRSLYEAKHAH